MEVDDYNGLSGSSTGPEPNRLAMLWRRKLPICLGALFGLTLGLIYYQQQPSVYQSTAQVLLVRKGAELQHSRVFRLDDYVASQAKLVASPLVVERALDEGKLSPQDWAGYPDPTGAIVASLSGRADGNVLNISFSGPEPDLCRRVLEGVIAAYESFLKETALANNEDTVRFLTKKANELHQQLEIDRAHHQQLYDSLPPLWRGSNGNTLQQDRLTSIESQRYQLRLQRAELESRLAALEQDEDYVVAGPDASGRTVSSEDLALELERELLPLRIKERALLEEFGEDFPEVRAVRQEIELKRELYNLQSRTDAVPGSVNAREAYLQSLREELKSIELSDSALAEMFERERAESQRLRDLQSKLTRLSGDIARAEAFHESLLNQLQQIRLGEPLDEYRTRILSPPSAGIRVGPSAQKIFTAAVVLGILGGIGLAYLVDITDKRFHAPDEICHRLGLPVVGQIPPLKPDSLEMLNHSPEGEGFDATLLDFRNSKSTHAEAFRNVRMALLFGASGSAHRVIQITSPNVGDGKTTVAANLAVSMAQAGKRTLLLDADLRTPRVHEMFGVSAKAGLASYLAGDAELQNVIQESGVRGLSIIACGLVPSNPAELLTSPRFKELIDILQGRYDRVIVDSPALLDVSDPCVVAHRVEAVLLVIRINQGSRFDSEVAIETMGTLAAKLFGVVVNNLDGRWRRSPPNLFNSHQPWTAARHGWGNGRFDRGAVPLSAPASEASSASPLRPAQRESSASPAAASPDLMRLEQRIQSLTHELRELMDHAQSGAAARSHSTRPVSDD